MEMRKKQSKTNKSTKMLVFSNGQAQRQLNENTGITSNRIMDTLVIERRLECVDGICGQIGMDKRLNLLNVWENHTQTRSKWSKKPWFMRMKEMNSQQKRRRMCVRHRILDNGFWPFLLVIYWAHSMSRYQHIENGQKHTIEIGMKLPLVMICHD